MFFNFLDRAVQEQAIINHRYQIVDFLGRGGMGITYKAKDFKNNSLVAIKIISLRESKNWKIIELFERETQILSCLKHPNIPNYLDHYKVCNLENQY